MLLLEECISACMGNSSCLSINYETGLCVLFSSSAEVNAGKGTVFKSIFVVCSAM